MWPVTDDALRVSRLDVSFSECSDHEHETSHETVSCFMKLSHETFHIQGISPTPNILMERLKDSIVFSKYFETLLLKRLK